MMSPPILPIRRVFQRYEINFPAPIVVAREAKGARRHWPIDDVTFRDDQSRLGTGHGAKNGYRQVRCPQSHAHRQEARTNKASSLGEDALARFRRRRRRNCR